MKQGLVEGVSVNAEKRLLKALLAAYGVGGIAGSGGLSPEGFAALSGVGIAAAESKTEMDAEHLALTKAVLDIMAKAGYEAGRCS